MNADEFPQFIDRINLLLLQYWLGIDLTYVYVAYRIANKFYNSMECTFCSFDIMT